MVSKQRRARQLARARFERQAERRADLARRRRRRNLVLAAVVAVVVVVGGVVLLDRTGSDDPEPEATATVPSATTAPTTAPADGPVTARCAYQRDGALAPGVTMPDPSVRLQSAYTATVRTNRGDIGLALDSAAAPCTVNAFVELARAGAFDGTECNKLTGQLSGGRFLECGDPTGAAETLGLTIPAENGGTDPYAAGSLVAAPAASGSSTSFRLLYDESQLGPGLTVFGTVADGLDVVQEVADGGLQAVGGQEPPEGEPALRTVVESVTVEGP